MVKTIKFNLSLDGNQVRDLNGLKENFNIDDLLQYFHSGLLYKWLNVRGYKELADQVENIKDCDDDYEVAITLIKLFNMEVNSDSIHESIYTFSFHKEQRELLLEYKKIEMDSKQIIDDYHQGYMSHYLGLLDNSNNLPLIKSIINEMNNKYYELLKLNAREFFDHMVVEAPLVIFAVLLNEKTRHIFLDHVYITKKLHDAQLIADLTEKLSDYIEFHSGQTDGYWKDIEPADKKVMIIYLSYGDMVRNLGKTGEELTRANVNGLFPILNGLDYKSQSSSNYVEYMEV